MLTDNEMEMPLDSLELIFFFFFNGVNRRKMGERKGLRWIRVELCQSRGAQSWQTLNHRR